MPTIRKVLFIAAKSFDPKGRAFVKAIEYAEANQAELSVLRVLPELRELSYATSEKNLESITTKIKVGAKNELETIIRAVHPNLEYHFTIVFGKVFFETIRTVIDEQFDIVIKQAENPSWLSSLFGSDDLHLVRKCPCPLLLVAESAPPMFSSVIASVDFSEDEVELELNKSILQQAVSFATLNNSKVHLLSVYDSSIAGFASLWVDEPEKLEQSFLNEEFNRRQYAANSLIEADLEIPVVEVPVLKHIVEGEPERTIPDLVKQLGGDLVVMGAVGRSGVMGMLIGNTAETVLLQLNCSVLVIKPKGFECPLHF